MKLLLKIWVVMAAMLLFGGCSTYFKSYESMETQMQAGNYQKASKILDGDKSLSKKRNALLYYFNKGYILHTIGEYDSSNYYFNQADYLIEDYKVNIGAEIGSFLFNPTITPYKAENFEGLMIHYYKALNYMYLKLYDDALVEAKRLNLKLLELDDKYPDKKNKYQNDAFSHLLMGLIYDAQSDYNNAFIAYRNALKIYESPENNFLPKNSIPSQLKKDIIRVSSFAGFGGDSEMYAKKYGISKEEIDFETKSNLVIFWENGRGPYKVNSFITLMIFQGEVGWIRFVNDEYNINFPFYIGDMTKEEQKGILDLKIFRMAIPKYSERNSIYQSAQVEINSKTYKFELIQDINAIAKKSLNDRIFIEISKSVLRLAVKKAAEIALTKKNGSLGSLLGIANALTEQADTRGWFTLPNTISYARIPLELGQNSLALKLFNIKNKEKLVDLSIEGVKATQFLDYKSIGWVY